MSKSKKAKKLYQFIVVMTDDEVLDLWTEDHDLSILSEIWLYFEKNEKNPDSFYINMNNVKYVRAVE